jgi:hypothetical protein
MSDQSFFNGGKMRHLFEFDDSFRYKPDGRFSSSEAEQALLEGSLYHKIDGSNGMVQVIPLKDGRATLKVFERRDTRGKGHVVEGQKLTKLPNGKNPDSYPKHTYYLLEVTKDVITKSLSKRNAAMLELVERHKDKLLSMDREWISVEWIGRKFQQTPGVPHDVAMAIHEDQVVEEEKLMIERSFDGLKKYLLEDCAEHPVEGLIVAHEGLYWKVVTKAFCERNKNPFHTNKENGRPPVFLA